ncbi:MAG: hypothetical protein LBF87_09385 [Treponema sp.]|nr:hypothetical protein [Treponema sp.]
MFKTWIDGIPIFYTQRKELTAVGCSFPAFFSGGKHEKQSRYNGNAQYHAGIGVYIHRMRDAGNEAQMLKSKLSLKGAPDSCRRDKTPYKNEFSEITLSPGTAAKNAVTAQGELTYAIQ